MAAMFAMAFMGLISLGRMIAGVVMKKSRALGPAFGLGADP
ncbi:protein of unknown function [Pseudorhizobium banfieldiae]|uniref:Uncharacterized protein n=1 Tax=Pseudorhizobium banfieldiae TaxID=1125847 RepID=L0NE90_9HYPH|nr:protein of unknown function [Pseudorhizobium banfieldiae]